MDEKTPITEAELQQAQAAEQSALDDVVQAHLVNRNVALRANLDRALAENAALRKRVEEQKPKRAEGTTGKP